MSPLPHSRGFAAMLDEYGRELAVEQSLPAGASNKAKREAENSSDRALARLAGCDPVSLLEALAKVDVFANHPRGVPAIALDTALKEARAFVLPSGDPIVADSCATCRFWDVYGESGALYRGTRGDCRRHAPLICDRLLGEVLARGRSTVIECELEHDLHHASVWAVTRCTDWCGEFERREAAA